LHFVDLHQDTVYWDVSAEAFEAEVVSPTPVHWYSVPEALAVLESAQDKRILERHRSPAPQRRPHATSAERWWLRLEGNLGSYDQLQRALARYWLEIRAVVPASREHERHLKQAHDALMEAEWLAVRDVEAAWQTFKHARRKLLGVLDETELETEYVRSTHEALLKLTGWRLAACKTLIAEIESYRSDPKTTAPPDADDLPTPTERRPTRKRLTRETKAQLVMSIYQLLDEYHDSYFDRAKAIQRRLWSLGLLGMAVLGIALLSIQYSSMFEAEFVKQGQLAPVLAVLGALCSALLSTANTGVRRPQVLFDNALALSRLVLGALSALAVLVVANALGMKADVSLALAFAAGFSERVLPDQLERLFGETDPLKKT
jgi:hypothetical protein